LTAKKQQTEHLRVGGIKIFLDGTLGSQTAAISHAYIGCNHGGQLLLSDEELKELTKQVWLADLPVCFHVIGDLGAAQALRIMKQLQNEKIFGQMHLEHLEICSPELIKEMKGQSVQIYFQPSHFLDDVVYLNSILPEPQKSWAFPWLLADEFEIPYFFGFDSPISSIGINRTRDGILHAEKFGIPKPKKDWSLYHSYPDPSWGPNIYTEWNSADQELAFPKIFNLKTNI
jgi:predicted amidohydrolase YtcJ